MTTHNQPGLNLADLAPMFENVPVRDSFLRVSGISAKTGLEIFQRYPKIAGMIGTGFDLKMFMAAAPEAVAAIIAAAAGSLGDAGAEEAAASLSIETQLDILEAVGRLTFTKGFGPFAKRVMDIVSAAGSENSSRA